MGENISGDHAFDTDVVGGVFTIEKIRPETIQVPNISTSVKVPVIQEKANGDPILANKQTGELWIGLGAEYRTLPTEAHIAKYADYRVPHKTTARFGAEGDLPYEEFLALAARQTYAELAGYAVALTRAAEAGREMEDDRWIIVAADGIQLDGDAVNRALQDAPPDAGVVHLAGFNKFGGFGELPVAVAGHDDLVAPTRFYGGEAATAYKPEALRAMAEAIQVNMMLMGDEGGISPLSHVLTLVQRCETLRIPANEEGRNPEYDYVRRAYTDSFEGAGAGNRKVYSMNPPATDGAQEVLAVPRNIAREMRDIVLPEQLAGNAAFILMVDKVVAQCVTPEQGQERLPPAEMLRITQVLAEATQSRGAAHVMTEIFSTYLAGGTTSSQLRGIGEMVAKISPTEDAMDAVGSAVTTYMQGKTTVSELQADLRDIGREYPAERSVGGRSV